MKDTILAQWAAEEKMIPDAPVEAHRSIMVAAPIDDVWRTLTSVSAWPQWHPDLANAKLHGDFAAGTRLTYGNLFKHKLKIAKVIAPHVAMIYGTLMGYTGITRWQVDQVGEHLTRVSFSESSDGLLIRAVFSNADMGKHLEVWLKRLKVVVENP